MKNWTIGNRLIGGFAVVILVVLFLGTSTWLKMNRVNRELTSIAQSDMPRLGIVENLRYELAMLRIINFKHAVYKEPEKKRALDKEATDEETRLAALLNGYSQFINSTEERTLFAKLEPLFKAYQAETLKLRQASSENKSDEVQAFLASAGKIGNDFIEVSQALEKITTDESETDTIAIENNVKTTKTVSAVAAVTAVILSLLIAILITRGIARILKRLVSELSLGAEQTTDAASQVSSASQSLAEGSSEQAASLEETSSSLEEMASMTKRNAENAQKANDLAKQARAAADKGSTDMQTMSAAMEAIKVSSDDIAKIIKTIDEIAFQTNILALNAAVEAARAGEAGMGFAVVADEVRNLAQRSAQAAKETAAKIEGAITNTSNGVEISTKVVDALNDIVTKVRQVDELVAEVAGASREQTQGITQINTAVSQMDKVTQSNAANAEESAAAAEELNAQAATMKQSVNELLQLVGGAQQTGQSYAPARNVPTISRPTAPMNHHTNGNGNGRSRAAAPVTTNGNGRHSEIPMEGDFKDF